MIFTFPLFHGTYLHLDSLAYLYSSVLLWLVNLCGGGLLLEFKCISNDVVFIHLVGWLVVFNVPSTARSFRDGLHVIYLNIAHGQVCLGISSPVFCIVGL